MSFIGLGAIIPAAMFTFAYKAETANVNETRLKSFTLAKAFRVAGQCKT